MRHEKLLQMRLQGKSLQEAGREAGYSENTLKGKIYKIAESAEYQATIQAHIEGAQIHTEEIIGVLISHMRGDIADFFPEDELLQQAKKGGISHLIKKVKRKPVVAGFDKDQNPIFAYETELEIQDQQAAAKHLTKVFDTMNVLPPARKAQQDFDAAVDRIMRRARVAGVTMEDEALRKAIIKRLKPLFSRVPSRQSGSH